MIYKKVMVKHRFNDGEVDFYVSIPWNIDTTHVDLESSLDFVHNVFLSKRHGFWTSSYTDFKE